MTKYSYVWAEALSSISNLRPFYVSDETDLIAIAEEYGISADAKVEASLKSSIVNECFFHFVLPIVWSEPFVISEDETPTTELPQNDAAIKQMRKAIAFWISTYPYYSKLLSLYESEGSKLLDQVATATDNKGGLSDMPQSSTFAEFVNAATSTDRLSQLTQSHSEDKSDYGTKMQRLDEIRRNYANLMQDWADEFIKTFVIY